MEGGLQTSSDNAPTCANVGVKRHFGHALDMIVFKKQCFPVASSGIASEC